MLARSKLMKWQEKKRVFKLYSKVRKTYKSHVFKEQLREPMNELRYATFLPAETRMLFETVQLRKRPGKRRDELEDDRIDNSAEKRGPELT
uniref:Uncharacterized protein n=1 Tax=Caenorhabditis japonica TaxID=281687 RepID=A0A8R1DT57_CAEJA